MWRNAPSWIVKFVFLLLFVIIVMFIDWYWMWTRAGQVFGFSASEISRRVTWSVTWGVMDVFCSGWETWFWWKCNSECLHSSCPVSKKWVTVGAGNWMKWVADIGCGYLLPVDGKEMDASKWKGARWSKWRTMAVGASSLLLSFAVILLVLDQTVQQASKQTTGARLLLMGARGLLMEISHGDLFSDHYR